MRGIARACELAAATLPPADRHPATSAVLHRVLSEHLLTSVERAHHDGGAGRPPFVERELRGFLDCGILAKGFARLRCHNLTLDGVFHRTPSGLPSRAHRSRACAPSALVQARPSSASAATPTRDMVRDVRAYLEQLEQLPFVERAAVVRVAMADLAEKQADAVIELETPTGSQRLLVELRKSHLSYELVVRARQQMGSKAEGWILMAPSIGGPMGEQQEARSRRHLAGGLRYGARTEPRTRVRPRGASASRPFSTRRVLGDGAVRRRPIC